MVPRTRALALAPLLALAACGPSSPRTPAPDTKPVVAAPAIAPPTAKRLERAGWIEATAEVLASADEAPRDALGRAKAAARRAATELAAGIGVKSSCLDFEELRGAQASRLNQCLTTVQVDAFVVDERVVEEKLTPFEQGSGYVQRVRLEARVLDRAKTRDKSFRAEVKLPKERYLDGEAVRLEVRATADARIYVLDVTKDGATLLLPNTLVPDTRVKANTALTFPDAALAERGVALNVKVPPGEKSAREAVLVVALRGDRELAGLAPKAGESFREVEATGAGALLADLLSPLFDVPADDWTFDQISYEVLSR